MFGGRLTVGRTGHPDWGSAYGGVVRIAEGAGIAARGSRFGSLRPQVAFQGISGLAAAIARIPGVIPVVGKRETQFLGFRTRARGCGSWESKSWLRGIDRGASSGSRVVAWIEVGNARCVCRRCQARGYPRPDRRRLRR